MNQNVTPCPNPSKPQAGTPHLFRPENVPQARGEAMAEFTIGEASTPNKIGTVPVHNPRMIPNLENSSLEIGLLLREHRL